MLIPNNNLVAIAYKTGYCGSLMCLLLASSPEVAQYKNIESIEFDQQGSAHKHNEHWFTGLHHFEDAPLIKEERWESYQTDQSKRALQDSKLVLFRCHPNVAMKLNFIENLKVIYMTHNNHYLSERWAYEKVYRGKGDDVYQRSLKEIIKVDKVYSINNMIRRNILIRNINHKIASYKQCARLHDTHQLNVENLLTGDFKEYTNVCKFLNITAITKERFIEIINKYNSKQWKRF
jgi:hypothetical protein